MAEQISATVSFEVAKKLAEAGYDQKGHIGLWYFGTPGRGFIKSIDGTMYYGPMPTWNPIKPLAAPTHLQAAAFLASKDYVVNFFIMEPPKPGNLWAQEQYGDEIIPDSPDPDSLILAICEHMEAANE